MFRYLLVKFSYILGRVAGASVPSGCRTLVIIGDFPVALVVSIDVFCKSNEII